MKHSGIMALTCCVAVSSTQAAVIEFSFPLTASQQIDPPSEAVNDVIQPAGVGFGTYDTEENRLELTIYYAGLSGFLAEAWLLGPERDRLIARTRLSSCSSPIDTSLPPGEQRWSCTLENTVIYSPSGTLEKRLSISEAAEADFLAGKFEILISAGEIKYEEPIYLDLNSPPPTEIEPAPEIIRHAEIRGRIAPIPEPGSVALLGLGGLLLARRRR